MSRSRFQIAAFFSGILAAIVLSGCGSSSSGGGDLSTCPKTCAANRANNNATTGFTDNTGFAAGNANECCDICAVEGAVVGTGYYDWDYIIMDNLFVPQFCHALQEGHDFTLTNGEGAKCTEASSSLTKIQIHGLWPNWNKGFSACCQSPASLDPSAAKGWSIFNDLQTKWSDAAADASCGVCYNLNHEWQKHGSCFTSEPDKYFEIGLALHASTAAPMNAVLDALAANAGKTMLVTDVIKAWNSSFTAAGQTPYAINLICDPHSETIVNGTSVNYLSELQVCWQRKGVYAKGLPVNSSDQLELRDCPAASKRGFTEPCNTTIAVYGATPTQTGLL